MSGKVRGVEFVEGNTRQGERRWWPGGRERRWQSVSHSVLRRSKPEQFQRSRKGAGTEVGTDLCDTHAARRITHSLAHNIHSPDPAESYSAPFPGPQRHPDERQTHQYCRTRPTWRYLLRIGIMLPRWFPHRDRAPNVLKSREKRCIRKDLEMHSKSKVSRYIYIYIYRKIRVYYLRIHHFKL